MSVAQTYETYDPTAKAPSNGKRTRPTANAPSNGKRTCPRTNAAFLQKARCVSILHCPRSGWLGALTCPSQTWFEMGRSGLSGLGPFCMFSTMCKWLVFVAENMVVSFLYAANN